MKKIFYLVIAATLILGSCTKENETEKTGSIYGVITDNTGEAIRTANVQLNTGDQATLGNDGQYEFADIEAGSYTLNVTKSGYKDWKNEIILKAGERKKVDVVIEKLPPSLRVVNDNKQDISELDFGDAEADLTRSFSIFNDGPESLEWEIATTATWINGVSKMSGKLNAGATQAIIVTIDRGKLGSGNNTTSIQITSDNGSKQLTVKATGRKIPLLNTLNVSNIAMNSATLNGEIIDIGIPPYTERGFVYSTITNPTISNTIPIVVLGSGTGVFKTNLTGLKENQLYYVRAYATNSKGTAYGQEVSFTPKDTNVVILQSAGLMVQKKDIGSGTWNSMKSLCENSILSGYTNWRLPTKDELTVLYNERDMIGGFRPYAGQTSGYYYYWSSTPYDVNEYNYWVISFFYGYISASYDYMSCYCRCVRNLP